MSSMGTSIPSTDEAEKGSPTGGVPTDCAEEELEASILQLASGGTLRSKGVSRKRKEDTGEV